MITINDTLNEEIEKSITGNSKKEDENIDNEGLELEENSTLKSTQKNQSTNTEKEKNILKKKIKRFKREKEANRNITRMLISTSFLYIFGNIPYSIYYISTRIFGIKPSDLNILFAFSQLSLYLLIILKVFVYYFFNRLFRKQLNCYFSILFEKFRI